MASVNAVMDKAPLATPIPRRKRNYQPNLWNDCFIQSLSSPYSASSYHDRSKTLRKEIKDMLNELGKEEANPTSDNLLERFRIVDVVWCLGIAGHFQNEIKRILDYGYKYWKEEEITLDLNATAMGFRILRLNGYHVSADVFKIFKDKVERFFCPETTKESHCELRTMLSLHRASELVFPGETILNEANIFTSKYLQHALVEWKESKADRNHVIMEVEYTLRYPWRCNVPRWEARNYIDMCREDNAFMEKKGDFNQKLIGLAILDFNILQCQHQSELKQVSRWWKSSGASQLDIFRHRHVEYFLWVACGLFEAEFGASRIACSKLSSICTILDDIYDTCGTLDELKTVTTALISREIPAADNVPHDLKVCLKLVLTTLDEIEKEGEKKQGYNLGVKKYARNCWENYILSYLKEAEWISSNYIPTLDQYLKNGYHSFGIPFVTIYVLLLMDTILSDKIFKELDFPSSIFQTHPPIIAWVLDDSKDFEEEKDSGESVSSIICFMRDDPRSTYEDALNYVNNLLKYHVDDLTREFFESRNIPSSYKKFIFNVFVRGLFFIYKDGDGFFIPNKEIKYAIHKILIEPIPL